MPPTHQLPTHQLPDGAAPAAPPPVLAEGQIPHPVTGQPTTWDKVMEEYTRAKAAKANLEDQARAKGKTCEALFSTVLNGMIERQWRNGPKIAGVGMAYLHTEYNPKKRQGQGHYPDGRPVPADESDEAFKERVVDAMDQAELGDKAPRSVNHQTLKGLFNSWKEEEIEPPAAVLEVYSFEPKRDVRVKRDNSAPVQG
jgi:hypothetical protein